MPEDNDQSNLIDPLTIGELISVKEAAELSDFHPQFLAQLAAKNRLRAKKMGRDWFTTLAAIEEYKKSRHRGKKL